MDKVKFMAMVVVIGLSTLLAAGGARAGDEQKFEDKQMRLAAKDANHGFDELDKVGAKLDKGKQKSAINHFENAADDFDQALTHLAKAEVGKDQEGVIDDLKSGVDALNKALKNLENGKDEDAQKHFDKANDYFNRAEAALN